MFDVIMPLLRRLNRALKFRRRTTSNGTDGGGFPEVAVECSTSSEILRNLADLLRGQGGHI
jgi:hypothetical protein